MRLSAGNSTNLDSLLGLCTINLNNKEIVALKTNSEAFLKQSIKNKDTVYLLKSIYYYSRGHSKEIPNNGLSYFMWGHRIALQVHMDEFAYKYALISGPEYRLLGMNDSALYCYQFCISHAQRECKKERSKENLQKLIRSQNNLAGYYSYTGKNKDALYLYIENENLIQEINDDLLAFENQVNIASIFQEMGLNTSKSKNKYIQKALLYYENCKPLIDKYPYVYGKAIYYKNYGELLLNNGQKIEGQQHIELAIQKFTEANTKDKLCGCYNTLGDVNMDDKSYKIAQEFYTKGIESAYKYTNVSCRMVSSNNLSNSLIQLGKYQMAKDTLLSILSFQEKNDYFKHIDKTHYNLYLVYKHENNNKEALYHYEKFISYKDSVFSEQIFKDLNRIESLHQVDLLSKSVNTLKSEKQELSAVNQAKNTELKNERLTKIIISIILIFIAFIIWIYYRIRYLKQKQIQTETEQLLLRARMNPHFIFNALNSIQNNFISGKIQFANQYLSEFSQFIRQVLYKTGKSKHALTDELQLTEMYVKLEQKKYPDKFEYQADIDPNIDIDMTFVPSFIFQPIIENSIFHGILNSEEKGLITLKISKIKNGIACSITDNGTSVEKPAAIESKHISQSLNILIQRLGKQSHFKMTKLLNNAGTVVQFKIVEK